MIALAALLLAAAQPPPAATGDDPIVVRGREFGPCGPPFAPLYVSAMGEPFRTNGASDPMRRWFDAADADRDGRVTEPEFAGQADRFFTALDLDRDGELNPQEVSAYEIDVAPEIRLYQADAGFFATPHGRKARRTARHEARDRADYVAALGAGRFGSLNTPEPVASADLDIDRGVSRAEFATVAARRFALLDPGGQGFLVPDALPRSPAQAAIDACLAGATKPRPGSAR